MNAISLPGVQALRTFSFIASTITINHETNWWVSLRVAHVVVNFIFIKLHGAVLYMAAFPFLLFLLYSASAYPVFQSGTCGWIMAALVVDVGMFWVIPLLSAAVSNVTVDACLCVVMVANTALQWVLGTALYMSCTNEEWKGRQGFLLLYSLFFLTTIPGYLIAALMLMGILVVIEFVVRVLTGRMVWFKYTIDVPFRRDHEHQVRVAKFISASSSPRIQSACLACMEEFQGEDYIARMGYHPDQLFHLACAQRMAPRKDLCPICSGSLVLHAKVV